MKTTETAHFEKGFMHGLAGVGRARTRKQILKDIVSEADASIDMSKGLQGRGDWCGSATKLINVAGLIDQGIDLAETLPGVRMQKTRQQVDMAKGRLGAVIKRLDFDPYDARAEVKGCENALVKAVCAVDVFADNLRDAPVLKDGEKYDFDERELIDAVRKMTLTQRTGTSAQRSAHAQSVGERAGLFGSMMNKPEVKNTTWHPEPGNPSRERRWNPQSEKYEYREKPTQGSGTVAAEKPENGSVVNKFEGGRTSQNFDEALSQILKADIDVDRVREAAVNAAKDIHGEADMEAINSMIENAKPKAKDTEDAIQIVINMMRAE